MVIQRKHTVRAYTLIEAMVATLILAGGLTTLSALNSRCMIRTRQNQQYDRAWQLMDRQLTLIDAMGIEQFLENRTTQGEIDDEEIVYQWNVIADRQAIDQLYRITMNITWFKGKQWYTISASTCLNGHSTESAEIIR